MPCSRFGNATRIVEHFGAFVEPTFACMAGSATALHRVVTRVPGQRSRGLQSCFKCGRDAGSHRSGGMRNAWATARTPSLSESK
jgi:hypothetical protein